MDQTRQGNTGENGRGGHRYYRRGFGGLCEIGPTAAAYRNLLAQSRHCSGSSKDPDVWGRHDRRSLEFRRIKNSRSFLPLVVRMTTSFDEDIPPVILTAPTRSRARE